MIPFFGQKPLAAGSVLTASTYFIGPTIGTNNGQITWAARVKMPTPGSTMTLFGMPGIQFRLEYLPNGDLRLNLKDNANATLINSATAGTVPYDTWTDIVASVDLAAGYAKSWIDGAAAHDLTFTSVPGTFQTNRVFNFLTLSSSGAVGTPPAIEFEHLSLWKDIATATGALPGAAPTKRIAPPAAAVNADGWKLGGDVT